jgi:NAD(P)H dehydrogenase (quinone)
MITRKFRKQFGISLGAVVLSFTCSPTQAADSVAPLSVLIVYHSASGNTEKMAQAVAEGAKGISGAKVLLKRVGEVAAEDLVSSDAVIVGTPVYFGNMSGEVKTFFDNWNLKFRLSQERRMANKVGGAFATGASISSGKELTILSIIGAMLLNQMIIVSGGGGFSATATTGPTSPGIDDKEVAEAQDLGKRVAEIAAAIKRGSAK